MTTGSQPHGARWPRFNCVQLTVYYVIVTFINLVILFIHDPVHVVQYALSCMTLYM